MKKIKELIGRHLFPAAVAISLLAGILLCTAVGVLSGSLFLRPWELVSFVISGIVIGAFIVYPLVLTVIEFCLLFRAPGRETLHKKGLLFDITAITLGPLYSLLYLTFLQSVEFTADWNIVLVNMQKHTPVYTRALPTVLVLGLVGIAGYSIVNSIPLGKMPPLLLVLGFAAMYLGTAESIIWGYQVCREITVDICLLLLPLNCLLITARTIACKMREWKKQPAPTSRIEKIPFLGWCNRILENALLWPFAAFLLMWPLLGILICILVLFGQSPGDIIRAWTETSDWNFSRQSAPQNIYYDEHYLCTVAAGGHRKIVKPLRLGVRHGHIVTVNRQLCVANAFEQILEEKTPRFHRALRSFYDRYGFPVARLIHSKSAADLIYFLMKPLEWFFLAVLYLCDSHPEDRIAVQYLPTEGLAALIAGSKS